ncbi:MAG: DEAD/DEAH box helicase [Bdellovibrionales bacterium]|nr:DEAD/DEAH box helicase [Bdellovibrionales bacterium]
MRSNQNHSMKFQKPPHSKGLPPELNGLTVKLLSEMSSNELKKLIGEDQFLASTQIIEGLFSDYDTLFDDPLFTNDLRKSCYCLGKQTPSSPDYFWTLFDRANAEISSLDISKTGIIQCENIDSITALVFLYYVILNKGSFDEKSDRIERMRRVLRQLFLPSPDVKTDLNAILNTDLNTDLNKKISTGVPVQLSRVILQSSKWLSEKKNTLSGLGSSPIIDSFDMASLAVTHHGHNKPRIAAFKSQKLMKAILFEFSDGSVFSLASLFYSPYIWLMEKEGPLRILLENLPEAGKYDWGEHLASSAWHELPHLVCGLIGIYLPILKNQLDNKALKVSLCHFNPNFYDPSRSIEIEQIDFREIDIKWKLTCRSSESQNQNEMILLGSLNPKFQEYRELSTRAGLDVNARRLSFYNLGPTLSAVDLSLHDHHVWLPTKSTDESLRSGELSIRLGQEFDYLAFSESLKRQDIRLEFDFSEVFISKKDRIQAYFDEEAPSAARVCFVSKDDEGEDFPLTGRFMPLVQILAGLRDGISGFLGTSSTDLASRNRFTRSSELKLYKHSGFFLFLILEYAQFLAHRTEDPAPENKSNDKKLFIKQLTAKLEAVGLKILGIANASETGRLQLADLAGQKFIRKLKSTVSELVDESSFVVTRVRNGKVFIVDYSQSLFQFLGVYADQISSHYQGKTFDRSNFKAFKTEVIWCKSDPKIPTSDEAEWSSFMQDGSILSVNILKEDGPVDRLPFFAANPQACFISGVLVETLSPEDLQTKFEMLENKNNIDWFELNPQVYFKGEEVPRDKMVNFLRDPVVAYKGRYYYIPRKQIPSLKWLNYFWNKLSNQSETIGFSRGEGGNVKFQKSEILNMLALKRAGVPIEGGPRWQQICAEYDRLGTHSESDNLGTQNILKKNLLTELKPFQKDGVQWMLQLYKLGLGGILADDMGLGKTVQTIAFFSLLREQGQLGQALIVVPTSLVHNWHEEFERFSPKTRVEIFDSRKIDQYHKEWSGSGSGSRTAKKKSVQERVVICTYGLLTDQIDFFNKFKWSIGIFDEAQNLKNINAKRTAASRQLIAEHKFCLTGTPMENHLGEFFSLMDLCVPGALGSYADYSKRYGSLKKAEISTEDIDFLRMKIKPLVLRRTKELVLNELPEKVETVIHMDFDAKQEKIYKDIAVSWNDRIRELIDSDGLPKSQLQMLTALLRLRQVCSFPQTVPNVKYQQDPPKLKALIANVSELIENGHSVVVFTNFVTTLELIKKRFDIEGLPALSFSGKDGANKRREILAKFNESTQAQILMMTLKTGGVGLNLTKANYVFHLEPWWNPAAENQASDRVHRIGQTRSVQIYRYIMRNSVEEKIQELKKIKSSAFAAMFSESERELSEQNTLSGSSLSREDFEMLLS